MRRTAELNRKYVVWKFLVQNGIGHKEARDIWNNEIHPKITNDMTARDIIKEIEDCWEEQELQELRQTMGKSNEWWDKEIGEWDLEEAP